MLFSTVRNVTGVLYFTALSCLAGPPTKTQPYFPNPFTRHVRPAQPGNPAIVNAASFLPGITPGGLASVFSQDLLSIDGTISASATPLPTEIAGVSVAINGIDAPLLVVSNIDGQDQINLQVPWETPTGPRAASIDIYDGEDLVATFETDSYTEDPGIFTYRGYALAIRYANSRLVGRDNPVSPGDVIILYTTGLGPVSVDVPNGVPGPADPLAYTEDPFDATVFGKRCDVLFSGLAPGFTGLYQLNLVLPDDLPPGDLDIQISTPYAVSGIAKLPVE